MVCAYYRPRLLLIEFYYNRKWIFAISLSDVKSYEDLCYWEEHLKTKQSFHGWGVFQNSLARACMARLGKPLYSVFQPGVSVDWEARVITIDKRKPKPKANTKRKTTI